MSIQHVKENSKLPVLKFEGPQRFPLAWPLPLTNTTSFQWKWLQYHVIYLPLSSC